MMFDHFSFLETVLKSVQALRKFDVTFIGGDGAQVVKLLSSQESLEEIVFRLRCTTWEREDLTFLTFLIRSRQGRTLRI